MKRHCACLGIAALLCVSPEAVSLPAQKQEKPGQSAQGQTFKVTTELVEVRAVVTDRQGKFVDNLRKEDFELLENNRPQEIGGFSVTRVAADGNQPPVAGGVTPTRPAPSLHERLAGAPARTVVLFIDTLHLSLSSLMQVKQALRRFMDQQLTGQDMVALVTSSGSLGIAEQFTRDRQLLRYAVDRISPGPPAHASFFSPYLAACVERGDVDAMNVAIALLRLEDGAVGDRRTMEMLARGRSSQVLAEASYLRKATLFTLKAVAGQMATLPGQRMITLFSDGFSLQDNGGPQTNDLQTVISRAVRSGVAIYSIDAAGLQPPPMFNAAMQGGGAAGPRLESYVSASEKDVKDGINALAADTGGQMYRNTNDLGGALGRAFDANRSYYVLAYYLAVAGDDRQFRRITVRVRNHSDYIVRTARGFVPSDIIRGQEEDAGKTPQQRLLRAINGPLPLTDLGVSVAADFLVMEGDDAQVSLTVHLDGDQLQYRQQDQRHVMAAEVLCVIYDSAGKVADSLANTVQGNLTPERLAVVRQNGYRLSRRVPLKPGVYQVRVGVMESGTERIGTASDWVEVPNLARSKLALSSLVLLDPPAAGGAAMATVKPDTLGGSRMVQGVRLYPRSQTCAYLLRVFRTAGTPSDSPPVMQTELWYGGKSVRQDNWRPISAAPSGIDAKGWFPISGGIDLAGLEPGLYELRVTVKDPVSKKSAERTVVFGVE